MQEYNKHMLQILTIHEAYPGHYVQLEYSNRNPSLIRKVLSSGVFAEGWAVYTEQMMLDEGYGKGADGLKIRLNQLKWYLRAVTNAILDYKMHCTGMTDEEALLFLVLRAYQIGSGSHSEDHLGPSRVSCQLSTYFVGRMAFTKVIASGKSRPGKANASSWGRLPRSLPGSRVAAGAISGRAGNGSIETATVRYGHDGPGATSSPWECRTSRSSGNGGQAPADADGLGVLVRAGMTARRSTSLFSCGVP